MAIQLERVGRPEVHGNSGPPVFTPRDSPEDWLAAKIFAGNADFACHQFVTHALGAHLRQASSSARHSYVTCTSLTRGARPRGSRQATDVVRTSLTRHPHVTDSLGAHLRQATSSTRHSHVTRTSLGAPLSQEPASISVQRNLAGSHPVHKLLRPHLTGLVWVNENARGTLVNAVDKDGLFEGLKLFQSKPHTYSRRNGHTEQHLGV